MSRHTTFRVGGEAECVIVVETKDELSKIISYLGRLEQEYFILGNGSNLLVGDGGYRGVMVALNKAWSGISTDHGRIRAGAGALLSAVAKQALRNALTGLEFASGIPGTVGGAVVMNAGAYGAEMADVLGRVTLLTPEGNVLVSDPGELALGYRASNIPGRNCVVLEAEFSLDPGREEQILQRMEEFAARRKEKQPLEYPSAGSTFKRPAGHFAGKLIEDAGLRGFSVGGAQVSKKHCGFVINRGKATARDVRDLCQEVQKRVLEHSGVELELEVRLLGEF